MASMQRLEDKITQIEAEIKEVEEKVEKVEGGRGRVVHLGGWAFEGAPGGGLGCTVHEDLQKVLLAYHRNQQGQAA